MYISGRISYQDLEGGFWGILGDDGCKYLPIDGLPESFQKDELRVEAEVETVHMVGTAMWGQYVKVLSMSSKSTS